jgi:hypothetical protein
MRDRILRLSAALALMAGLAAPAALRAAEAEELIDATDPMRVLTIAQKYGEAALTTDGMGDPLIKGTLGGWDYLLYFYDCTDNRDCQTVMFQAAWDTDEVTEAMLAEWNREERFGKAFLDKDERPTVEMNVNLHGGVAPANLDDTFDWWRVVVERFVERYDF